MMMHHILPLAHYIYIELRDAIYHIAVLDAQDKLIWYQTYEEGQPYFGSVYTARVTHIDSMTRMAHSTILHDKILKDVYMKAHNCHEGQQLYVQLHKYPRVGKIHEASANVTIDGRYWHIQKGKDSIQTDYGKLEMLDDALWDKITIKNRTTVKKYAFNAPLDDVVQEYNMLQAYHDDYTQYQPTIWSDIMHYMPSQAQIYAASSAVIPILHGYKKNYGDITHNIIPYNNKVPLLQAYNVDIMLDEALAETHYCDNGCAIHIYETPSLCVIDIDQASYKDSMKDRAIIELNKYAITYIIRLLTLRQIGGMVVIDIVKPKNFNLLKDIIGHTKKCVPHNIMHVHGISRMGLLELHSEKTSLSLWESQYYAQ